MAANESHQDVPRMAYGQRYPNVCKRYIKKTEGLICVERRRWIILPL